MKKLLISLLMFVTNIVLAQTFPVQNLQVNGTQNTVGVATFQTPIAVTSGGIGTGTASGTALDNITGFSSTGFLTRTGANTYTFQSLTNGINLGNLSQVAANTVLANATASTANLTAFSVPGCSASTNALTWTTNSGFTCNSSINAATLGGATFASPGPIGSTTPGTGAFVTASQGTNSTTVATTAFVANHSPCLSIIDFGGDSSGTNDNSTAFTNVLAAQPTTNRCVYFPPGKYKFNSAQTISYPGSGIASITLQGAGSDNSILFWNGVNGITVSENVPTQNIHIRDLSFTTNAVGTFTALTMNNATAEGNFTQNDVINVTFRGDEGGQSTNYWNFAIVVNKMSNVNFVNDLFYGPSGAGGTGILVQDTTSCCGIVYNVMYSGFFNLSTGFLYGTNIQGVTIGQSNFTNGTTGIAVQASATNAAQLTIVGSQINTTANQILINAGIASLIVQGNLIYIPANNGGILFSSGVSTSSQITINGNTFAGSSATGSTGVNVQNNSTYGVVTGNSFFNLNNGLNLTGTSTWNVQANVYQTVTTQVANPGSNSVGVATK